jgi:hypothetical protein
LKLQTRKNTLNSITFALLIQKWQNNKCAYHHLVEGILTIQKPMVSKGMAWSHPNKGCVTPWPRHLHLKVSKGKRRMMETQIFHHAKI